LIVGERLFLFRRARDQGLAASQIVARRILAIPAIVVQFLDQQSGIEHAEAGAPPKSVGRRNFSGPASKAFWPRYAKTSFFSCIRGARDNFCSPNFARGSEIRVFVGEFTNQALLESLVGAPLLKGGGDVL